MSANNTEYSYSQDENSGTTARVLVFRYLRHWPWFVLSISVTLAGAFLYLRYKEPVYRTQASLLLLDDKKEGSGEVMREFQPAAPKKSVENEIEILRSGSLMGQVVEKLHLQHHYYHQLQFRQFRFGRRELFGECPIELIVEQAEPVLYKKPLTVAFVDGQTALIDGQKWPLNQSVNTPYGRIRIATRQPVSARTEPVLVQASTRQAAAGAYVNRLKIEPTSKTSSVVVLTLDDEVPAKGEAVLNALIAEYNLAAIQSKNKVAANTLQFVQQRLGKLAGELEGVEQRVESYKTSRGITSLGDQAQAFLMTAKENDARLNDVNIQMSALRDLQTYVKSQPDDQGGAPTTVGLSDPVLIDLINKASSLELKRAEQIRTTPESNPIIQTTDAQIKATKRSIGENIQTRLNMLERSRDTYQARNESITQQMKSVPASERALMDISRQQSIKNELYTYLLQKREETAVAFAAAVSDSRTVDSASSDPEPVKPVKPMIFLLFGVVGLLLPIGVIAGTDALTQRVRSRYEVERATNTPILGELAVSPASGKQWLVITPRSRSRITEQIRALRANLPFLSETNTDSQVLLVTSSTAGEGKSFVSLNLGASLALVGHPTIVLEMDLRMPTYQQGFHLDNNLGISEYLSGEATLDQVMKPVPGYQNLFMISSGTLGEDQNPAEVLSSPRLRQLVADLRERFSYVVMDTPPLGLVSDARLLAPYADTTLYIVRHGKTPIASLRAVEMLRREQRFKNLQLVLNSVVGNDGSYLSQSDRNRYYRATPSTARRWLKG